MGRPLNKRLFTTAAGGATAGANEIKVNFNSGGGVKAVSYTHLRAHET